MRLPHNNFLTQCSFYTAAFGLSLGIVFPTFAADNITLHIKGKPLVVTTFQLEDYSQTGDLSSLPPEVAQEYPDLEPEEQEALRKLPAQLKRPINIRPGEQLDPDEQDFLNFLVPSKQPQEQQQVLELMAEKGNGQVLLDFLKALPVETLTRGNFLSVLTSYVPVPTPKKKATTATTLLSSSTGQVGTIDPTTGIFTPLLSGIRFADIALSNDNKLFGVENSTGNFYHIDLETGVSSRIGYSKYMGGLGFSANNVLYGVGDGLYTIDTLTGNSSLIAKLPGSIGVGDIVFDPINNRFLATPSSLPNKLFSIDLTGAVTEIGDMGFYRVLGLFFQNGILFGYTGDGKQIIINTVTGAGTFDKNVTGASGEIWGAASLPSTGPKTSVPEPSTVFSLAAFSLFGIGFLLKRRR